MLLDPVISKQEQSRRRSIREATLVHYLHAIEERQCAVPVGRSLLPVGAAFITDLEELLVRGPGTDQEVEIMTAAAHCGRIAGRCAWGARVGGASVGGPSVRRGNQYDTKAAKEAREVGETIHAVLSTASTFVDSTVYTRSHECQTNGRARGHT